MAERNAVKDLIQPVVHGDFPQRHGTAQQQSSRQGDTGDAPEKD